MTLWLTLLEPPESRRPVPALIGKSGFADGAWVQVRRQFEANKIRFARC